MPYVKKTITAGRTVEVCKHYSARYGKRCERSPRREPTGEAQQEVNQRNAEARLRQLLNTNFGVGDWHLVLGYKRTYQRMPEEARHDLNVFLRGYRQHCRENGIPVRYVTVTEYENRRIHHHLVIGAIPMTVLYALWPYGRPHITPLDSSGNYAQLASYLIKETSQTFSKPGAATRKRWTQSKGLKKLIVKTEIIHADKWQEDPRPKKGYYIPEDGVVCGVHEWTGMPYQRYIMIAVSDPRAGPKARG